MGITPGRLSTKSARERCGTDHPIYTDQREANPLSLRKGSVSFGSQLTRVDVVYMLQMAAGNVNDVDLVLALCGVENEVARGNIIAWEGFESLDDLGILEDD